MSERPSAGPTAAAASRQNTVAPARTAGKLLSSSLVHGAVSSKSCQELLTGIVRL